MKFKVKVKTQCTTHDGVILCEWWSEHVIDTNQLPLIANVVIREWAKYEGIA